MIWVFPFSVASEHKDLGALELKEIVDLLRSFELETNKRADNKLDVDSAKTDKSSEVQVDDEKVGYEFEYKMVTNECQNG